MCYTGMYLALATSSQLIDFGPHWFIVILSILFVDPIVDTDVYARTNIHYQMAIDK